MNKQPLTPQTIFVYNSLESAEKFLNPQTPGWLLKAQLYPDRSRIYAWVQEFVEKYENYWAAQNITAWDIVDGFDLNPFYDHIYLPTQTDLEKAHRAIWATFSASVTEVHDTISQINDWFDQKTTLKPTNFN